MSFDVLKLARPEIVALEPYISDRLEGDLESGIIALDVNENSYAGTGNNRYPLAKPQNLYNRLADIYGVDQSKLLVTRGSDDAIDCIIRAFCSAGEDAILTMPPTFGMYKISAKIQGAACFEVPLTTELEVDFNAIDKSLAQNANIKIVFLCSPQNPVGSSLSYAKMLKTIKANPQRLFVADEAYIEFSSQKSLLDELDTLPNLIILRTLSKAYGLAGLRIGIAISSPDILGLVAKILPPFLLPTPSVNLALTALSPAGLAKCKIEVEEIISERKSLTKNLMKLPCVKSIADSDANFILVKFADASASQLILQKAGIKVKPFTGLIENCLRITVGSPAENKLVLAALGADINLAEPRIGYVERTSKETSIFARVNLDSDKPTDISTGIEFFDHMLEQVSKHSGIGFTLKASGDIGVDAHHTVEDCMIVLGQAFRDALGDKRGVKRYGFSLPMDEARADVLIDLSGRGHTVFNCTFKATMLGQLPTEMIAHAVASFAESLKAAIHVDVVGTNDHHKAEAVFKGLAKALKEACKIEGNTLPTTKGMLA